MSNLPGNVRTNNYEGDFYPTPQKIVEDILKREKLEGTILEPACGDGSMIRVLRRYYPHSKILGFDLYPKSHKYPRVDFLTWGRRYDCIITNPPYDQFLPFLKHSLALANKKVVLLFPLTYLSGKSRYLEVFSHSPPTRIWVYSRRISLTRGELKIG